MESISNQLQKLFKKWRAKLAKDTDVQQWEASTGGVFFTTDGIMNAGSLSDEEWFDPNRVRVAFILKDQYQRLDNGHHSKDDVRNYKTDKNTPFFVNLRNIFWGLSHTSKHNPCKWNSILENEENVKEYFQTTPYAIIEAKKTPGGGSLNDKILKHHLDKYGKFLLEELEILKPNFIICCCQEIFKTVLDRYKKKNSVQIFEDNGWVCYDIINKVFIIPAYHPSDWSGGKTYEQHFNFVLNNNHFNSVLKLIPDDKLPKFLI